jgi:hypothetical protein
MLNRAVTLYLFVFLFVRRLDDIVVGEDGDSEKEDIVDECRIGGGCGMKERCYPRVERELSVNDIYGTQTLMRATPALDGKKNTGKVEPRDEAAGEEKQVNDGAKPSGWWQW